MAEATERSILEKVQSLILDKLVSGQGWGQAAGEIESILNAVGVTPTNPQYAQMVFRTNAMDAFNVGQEIEVTEHPEVKDFFPAFEYLGIRDGREGEDHRPKFGKYYPSSLSFQHVRGPRVWNCRCSPRYVDKYEWDDLKNRGERFSNV